MKCVNHSTLDAVEICEKCGKGLCINCKLELHSRTYCHPCAQEILTALTLINVKDGRSDIDTLGSDKRGLRWSLIYKGALVTLVIGFIFESYAGFMYSLTSGFNAVNDTTLILILVSIEVICLLVGGFIVGTKAGYRGAKHGLSTGLIVGIGIATFSLLGMLYDGTGTGWIILTLAAELLLSPGFGALGGFLGERLRNR